VWRQLSSSRSGPNLGQTLSIEPHHIVESGYCDDCTERERGGVRISVSREGLPVRRQRRQLARIAGKSLGSVNCQRSAVPRAPAARLDRILPYGNQSRPRLCHRQSLHELTTSWREKFGDESNPSSRNRLMSFVRGTLLKSTYASVVSSVGSQSWICCSSSSV
jgi:hypothetical protein